MPAPLVASVSLIFKSKGLRKAIQGLRRMSGGLGVVRQNMFALGVTTIFVDRLIQSFTRAWKAMNTVLGLGRVAKAAADFQRISKFTRVGTVRLQAFTAVAKEVGADLNDVADLFSTISERVDDLRTGKGSVVEDFGILGLNKNSFAGMDDGYSQWTVIAQAMADANEATKRLSFGEKILGGDINRKFGALIEGGVANLEALQLEALATGEVMTDAELEIGRQYERSSLRLGRVFTAISNQLSMTVMDPIRRTLDLISMVGFKVGKFLRESSQIRDTIQMIFDPLYDRTRNFLTWWDRSVKGLGPTILRIGVALAGVFAIAQAPQLAVLVSTFKSLLFFAKWGGLAIEDLIGYMSGMGGPSLFAALLPTSPMLQALQHAAKKALGSIGVALTSIKNTLVTIFSGPLGTVIIASLLGSLELFLDLVTGIAVAFEYMARSANVVIELSRHMSRVVDAFTGVDLMLPFGGNGGTQVSTLPGLMQDIRSAWDPARYGQTSTDRAIYGGVVSGAIDKSTRTTINITGSNAGPQNSTGLSRPGALATSLGAQ